MDVAGKQPYMPRWRGGVRCFQSLGAQFHGLAPHFALWRGHCVQGWVSEGCNFIVVGDDGKVTGNLDSSGHGDLRKQQGHLV